jgi:hypothetical protein
VPANVPAFKAGPQTHADGADAATEPVVRAPMADDDRLLASVTAQDNGADRCVCGESANLCRVTRYLHSEPCCEGCVHAP